MEHDRPHRHSVCGKFECRLLLLSNHSFVQMNVIIFSLVLRASIQMKDAVSDFGNLKTLLCLSILLLPLLGCNWILALLTVNEYLDGLFASSAYYLVSLATAIYVFIGYCLVNRIVRLNLKHTWCRLTGRNVSAEESLSVTRMTLASRNAHSSFVSPFDVHRSPRSFGVTTSSTTSRSTTTKTSSGPDVKRSRKHRRHRRRFIAATSVSESNPSLSLASSHSSDEDEGNSVAPTQNEINSVIQQSLNVSTAEAGEEPQSPTAEVTGTPLRQEALVSDYGIIGPKKIINHESRPYTRSNIFAMGLGGSPESEEGWAGDALYSRRRESAAPEFLLSPDTAAQDGQSTDNKQETVEKQDESTFDQDPGEQDQESDHQSSRIQ